MGSVATSYAVSARLDRVLGAYTLRLWLSMNESPLLLVLCSVSIASLYTRQLLVRQFVLITSLLVPLGILS